MSAIINPRGDATIACCEVGFLDYKGPLLLGGSCVYMNINDPKNQALWRNSVMLVPEKESGMLYIARSMEHPILKEASMCVYLAICNIPKLLFAEYSSLKLSYDL